MVCWASCSYSEPFTYGYTSNAAGSGLAWDMSTLLPKEAGLTVNSVIYQYTTVKRPEDAMLVHVQNLNAKGEGYIFRSTDDWTGRPGNTINKAVSVNDVPIGFWGRGSIQVDGEGAVKNPTVVYTYRVDQCFDAKNTPGCPGYQPPIPEITLYNALEDPAVQLAAKKLEQKQEEQQRRMEAKEQALKESRSAESLAQKALLDALNAGTNLNSYYALKINGGVYRETIVLKDSRLPESKVGLRNGLAQQLLHTKMVDMQYERQP